MNLLHCEVSEAGNVTSYVSIAPVHVRVIGGGMARTMGIVAAQKHLDAAIRRGAVVTQLP